jgi:hypothetical protein
MNKQLYSGFTFKDFNQFDCLKLSLGIYAILAFVTRGYIVWIMSITNMKNQTDTIAMIFPDPRIFYLSLVSGVLGLFVILVISLRRPSAAAWVKYCWKHIRIFLLFTLAVNLIVSIWGYAYLSLLSFSWLLSQVFISLVFVIFLYTSQRVKLNIQEFPEDIVK